MSRVHLNLCRLDWIWCVLFKESSLLYKSECCGCGLLTDYLFTFWTLYKYVWKNVQYVIGYKSGQIEYFVAFYPNTTGNNITYFCRANANNAFLNIFGIRGLFFNLRWELFTNFHFIPSTSALVRRWGQSMFSSSNNCKTLPLSCWIFLYEKKQLRVAAQHTTRSMWHYLETHLLRAWLKYTRPPSYSHN